MSRKSSTGYKGVSQQTGKRKRYEAYFMLYNNDGSNKIKYYIGLYDTPELAHIARINFIDSLK